MPSELITFGLLANDPKNLRWRSHESGVKPPPMVVDSPIRADSFTDDFLFGYVNSERTQIDLAYRVNAQRENQIQTRSQDFPLAAQPEEYAALIFGYNPYHAGKEEQGDTQEHIG